MIKNKKFIILLISIIISLICTYMSMGFLPKSTIIKYDIRTSSSGQLRMYYMSNLSQEFSEDQVEKFDITARDSFQPVTFAAKSSNMKALRLDFFSDDVVIKNLTINGKPAEKIIGSLKEFEMYNCKIEQIGNNEYKILADTDKFNIYKTFNSINGESIYAYPLLASVFLVILCMTYSVVSVICRFYRNIGVRGRDVPLYVMFFVILFIPMLFLNPNTQSLEKRDLAEKPKLINNGDINPSFPSQFEAWFGDHFGFRNQLVAANVFLNYDLMNVSTTSDVTIGSNGFLFYTPAAALATYQHTDLYTDEELAERLTILKDRKEQLAKSGIQYIFVICPDKSTIYSENFPSNVKVLNKMSRAEQFVKYVKENSDVEIMFPKENIMKNKDKGFLYLKNDTHWSGLGAFFAYQELSAVLANYYPQMKPLTFKDVNTEQTKSWVVGDLTTMLGVSEDNNWVDIVIPNEPVKVQIILENGNESFATNGEIYDKKFKTITPDYPELPKAVIFRDSFFKLLLSLISRDFSEAHYVWQYNFDYNIIDEHKPDIVIQELVERNLELAFLK